LGPALQEQQRKRFEEDLAKTQTNSPPATAPTKTSKQSPIGDTQPEPEETNDGKVVPPEASIWSALGGWAWQSKTKEHSSDSVKDPSSIKSQQNEA